MARGVTTGGLVVLALVLILVSIPASTEGKKTTTARPRRTTTARIQKKSTTTIRTPSTTKAQKASSTIIPNTPMPKPKPAKPRRWKVSSSQLEWKAKGFPNPQLQPELCSRGNMGSWVCDPNGVISETQANTINDILARQSAMGKCQCDKEKCAKSPSHKGIQGAVALVNKMYFLGSNPTSKELRTGAEKFAEYLRDKNWEYEMCHDDYVIFVSIRDKQVVTARGKTARKVMTDSCVKRVMGEARSLISRREYGRAVELIVKKYTDVLRKQHPCNRPGGSKAGPVGGIVGGIVAFIGLICCCGLCCYCFKKRNESESAAL